MPTGERQGSAAPAAAARAATAAARGNSVECSGACDDGRGPEQPEPQRNLRRHLGPQQAPRAGERTAARTDARAQERARALRVDSAEPRRPGCPCPAVDAGAVAAAAAARGGEPRLGRASQHVVERDRDDECSAQQHRRGCRPQMGSDEPTRALGGICSAPIGADVARPRAATPAAAAAAAAVASTDSACGLLQRIWRSRPRAPHGAPEQRQSQRIDWAVVEPGGLPATERVAALLHGVHLCSCAPHQALAARVLHVRAAQLLLHHRRHRQRLSFGVGEQGCGGDLAPYHLWHVAHHSPPAAALGDGLVFRLAQGKPEPAVAAARAVHHLLLRNGMCALEHLSLTSKPPRCIPPSVHYLSQAMMLLPVEVFVWVYNVTRLVVGIYVVHVLCYPYTKPPSIERGNSDATLCDVEAATNPSKAKTVCEK
mmetsp:Transcript_29991/g.97635  ORF Transcript_29991/g.97635 Transcript_29991/m.97635 type:complete len:427 (-) Transcript_29991:868-2148(-)